MITTVLNFWLQVFEEELRNNVDDDLRLVIVKKAPFQEDPTRKAPYLLLDVNEEKGLEPMQQEIGGRNPWKLNMILRAAPRVQTSAEAAYHLVDILTMRLMNVIRVHSFDTVNIEANGGYISNSTWNLIDGIYPKVYGGEREWLSYVVIHFWTGVAEPARYSQFPTSTERPDMEYF